MSNKLRKILSLALTISLLFQQIGFAQIATELNIASHLSRMTSNLMVEKFRPAHLRYFSYDALNDNFKVLLDKGDLKNLGDKELQSSTKTLLSYFLVGVTLPDSMFWVNLRPDSEDQIIDQYLEKTDIGKIMLEADLQLKKDTSAMTSPATPEGKEYWDKLYKKAAELFGYDNVSIPTLTRPWIVPGEIIVRESKESAYVYKANLKVMLEQDYLKDSATYNFKDERSKALNEYSSELIRELIIPKLTREVNSSKRYAPLRQVYYSLILARWFKLRFSGKTGTYASLINTKDLTNLISQESWSKSTYFKQYQQSFAKGEYNIQEPVYTPTGQTIRSYFSGGLALNKGMDISNPKAGFFTAGSPARIDNFPNTAILQGNSATGIGVFAASPVINVSKTLARVNGTIQGYSGSTRYFYTGLKGLEISNYLTRLASGVIINLEYELRELGIDVSVLHEEALSGVSISSSAKPNIQKWVKHKDKMVKLLTGIKKEVEKMQYSGAGAASPIGIGQELKNLGLTFQDVDEVFKSNEQKMIPDGKVQNRYILELEKMAKWSNGRYDLYINKLIFDKSQGRFVIWFNEYTNPFFEFGIQVDSAGEIIHRGVSLKDINDKDILDAAKWIMNILGGIKSNGAASPVTVSSPIFNAEGRDNISFSVYPVTAIGEGQLREAAEVLQHRKGEVISVPAPGSGGTIYYSSDWKILIEDNRAVSKKVWATLINNQNAALIKIGYSGGEALSFSEKTFNEHLQQALVGTAARIRFSSLAASPVTAASSAVEVLAELEGTTAKKEVRIPVSVISGEKEIVIYDKTPYTEAKESKILVLGREGVMSSAYDRVLVSEIEGASFATYYPNRREKALSVLFDRRKGELKFETAGGAKGRNFVINLEPAASSAVMSEQEVRRLIELLASEKDRLPAKGEATKTLKSIRDKEDISILKEELLNNKSSDLRSSVAQILGAIGNEYAVDALMEAITTKSFERNLTPNAGGAIDDRPASVLFWIIYSLGEAKSRKSVDLLTKIADGSSVYTHNLPVYYESAGFTNDRSVMRAAKSVLNAITNDSTTVSSAVAKETVVYQEGILDIELDNGDIKGLTKVTFVRKSGNFFTSTYVSSLGDDLIAVSKMIVTHLRKMGFSMKDADDIKSYNELPRLVHSMFFDLKTVSELVDGAKRGQRPASSAVEVEDFLHNSRELAREIRLRTIQLKTGRSVEDILEIVGALNFNTWRDSRKDFYEVLRNGVVYFHYNALHHKPEYTGSYEGFLVEEAIKKIGVDKLTILSIVKETGLLEEDVRDSLLWREYQVLSDGRVTASPKDGGAVSSAVREDIDASLRSASIPDKGMGGIDFRVLPMSIQPMGSFQGLNFKLPQLSQAQLAQINIDSEMQQIKNMVKSGILPSGQRIKELIAACSQKQEISSRADNLLLCLIDICKLEEENAYETSPELREALVIVDSLS